MTTNPPQARRTHRGPRVEEPATKCDPAKCQLPDCMCGGTEMPGNIIIIELVVNRTSRNLKVLKVPTNKVWSAKNFKC